MMIFIGKTRSINADLRVVRDLSMIRAGIIGKIVIMRVHDPIIYFIMISMKF